MRSYTLANSHAGEKKNHYRRAGIVLICLLIGLAAAATAVAQQRITGTVTDRSKNEPLTGIAVLLGGENLARQLTATTDDSGRFSFAGLSPGTYTVSASAETFRPVEVSVELGPRAAPHIDLELRPIADIRAEVTVSEQAKLLDETEAATITNISARQIQDLPAAKRTQLTDVITPYVSSVVAGHDNFVHLRGNELSLNTFINGVSFYDNPHQIFTPGISPDIVQSVNVFTGGFPAEFGNRFGGILDIVTRGGFDANGHGSVTLGGGNFSRNNFSADYGGHTGRFGYFFYGQGFESGRFLNTPVPEVFHDRGRGARSFAADGLSLQRQEYVPAGADRRRDQLRAAERDRGRSTRPRLF